MKYIETEVNGKPLFLMYNGAAMFDLQERYTHEVEGECGEIHEEPQNITEVIEQGGKKGFEALCDVAAVLAEQGELYRRFMGYDRAEIMTAKEIAVLATPEDILNLRLAVIKAVILGLKREVDDPNEERDLVLEELNKKKIK